MVMRRKRSSENYLNSTDPYLDGYELSGTEQNSISAKMLKIIVKFMKAWVKNKLTDVKECHLYHICKGNTFSSTKTLSREVVESFGEIATLGLVRELGRHKS